MSIGRESCGSFSYLVNKRTGDQTTGWVTDGTVKIDHHGIDFVTDYSITPFFYEDACFKQFCAQMNHGGKFAVGPHIIDYVFTVRPDLLRLTKSGMQRPDAIGFVQIDQHLAISTLGEFKYRKNGGSLKQRHEISGMNQFLRGISLNTQEFILALSQYSDGFIPNMELVIPNASEIEVVFMSTSKREITRGTMMEFPFVYRRVSVEIDK
jgi:hypothetical protein